MEIRKLPLFSKDIPNIAEPDRIAALRAGYDAYPEDEPLSPEDEAVVRACLDDKSRAVVKLALEILLGQGPVTWEDLQQWLKSPVDDIRSGIVLSATLPETTAAGKLCASDKDQCANLLADALMQHPNDTTQLDIQMLGQNEEGWLDPTWKAMDRLLDMGDEQLSGRLAYGYFASTIQHFAMGPDDPHIRPWLVGSDSNRKMILLEITRWLNLRDEYLIDIAAALVEDSDEEISTTARQILAER